MARESQCGPVVAVRPWFHFTGQPCPFHSRRQTLARRGRLDGILRDLEAQQRLRVIDLFDVFCPSPTCTHEGNRGVVLYRDACSHPSIDAARWSAPRIRAALIAPPASPPAAAGN
ncbi:SGNH hydrolase domain-containing protein [Synechococcus sp. CCY 9618]|uniref:SGNH hydrolase domain-containing protein n=1 Tax=Synechococcus sp. CCY 9618 TaxID=2815602 RepID=UPI00352C4840